MKALPVKGYIERSDKLYRFDESEAGDFEITSAICPRSSVRDRTAADDNIFVNVFPLGGDGPARDKALVVVLMPHAASSAGSPIGNSCSVLSQSRGSLLFDDRDALVKWARDNDVRMQFHRGMEEMPGYRGIGLPADATVPPAAVRAEGIADLKSIVSVHGANLDLQGGIRLTTAPGIGTYSAAIPVKGAAVAGPGWLVVKLLLRDGRIGFGALTRDSRLVKITKEIAPSPEPQSIALRMDDLHDTVSMVIFNQRPESASAAILDAAVYVLPSGPGTNPTELAAVR
jgi:hypothetical protein